MVSTGLYFTDGIWIATAGEEFILAGGGGHSSDDVIGIEGEVFLDERAFRMVEVEYSIDSLALRFHLDFEQSQEVTVGCLKVYLKAKVQMNHYNL